MAKVTCPKCKGKGTAIGFAIPKEDYEKGYSGYALFSCNKLNSVLGCKNCGGSGVEYKDWFKKESPESVKDESEVIEGSGEVEEPNEC
jgi:hypothetical protein